MSDLGAAYAIAGQYDDAVPMLQHSLEIMPSNAQAHFNLGLIAASRGDMQAAVTHFEAALRLDPDNTEIAQALREAKGQR